VGDPSRQAAFPGSAASGLTLKPHPHLGTGWVTCHPLFHQKALSHANLAALGNRNEIQIHGVLLSLAVFLSHPALQ